MKHEKKHVVIIGAGLAGLSLATELVGENFDVTILEKNNYLGGRASNIVDPKMQDPVPIGPHIFLTAYNNLRHFFEKIDVHKQIVWERQRVIELVSKDKHSILHTAKLPPPLFNIPIVFNNNFLNFFDKLSGLPLTLKLLFSSEKSLEKLDHEDGYTFLKRWGVTERAIENYFSFITLSLNNVHPKKLSATEMTLLFKHWIELKHHNIGFARAGLGDIYTSKARRYIEKNGGTVKTNTTITKIKLGDNTVEYLEIQNDKTKEKMHADLYVSTLTPIQLREVLSKSKQIQHPWNHLKFFEPISYISVFLWFNKKITKKRFWALVDIRNNKKHLNTDFYDRSNIMHQKGGSFIASNIISSKKYEKMTDQEIIDTTCLEIREAFPNHKAKPVHAHVHRVPYVIYAPYPGMRKHKLKNKTPYNNLYLAGDWTSSFTQCMEAAVRSGYKCAEKIIEDTFDKKKKILNLKIQ